MLLGAAWYPARHHDQDGKARAGNHHLTDHLDPALNAVEPLRKISVHDSSSLSIWSRSLKLVRDPDKIGHFPKPRFDPCRHRRAHLHGLIEPHEIVIHEVERLGVVVVL